MYKLIEKSYLAELLRNSSKLECLEAGGVDNWMWYDESMKDYVSDDIDDDTLTESFKDA